MNYFLRNSYTVSISLFDVPDLWLGPIIRMLKKMVILFHAADTWPVYCANQAFDDATQSENDAFEVADSIRLYDADGLGVDRL